MQTNRLHGCPFTSFLILMICLQCSDNDFGGGNILNNILHDPGFRVGLLSVNFLRQLSSISRAIKKLLVAINV